MRPTNAKPDGLLALRLIPSAVVFLCLLTSAALSAEVHVFSGGAPQAALRQLAPEFEQATGHKLAFTFRLVTEIQRKLATGEKADLILLPVPLIAATEKTLPLRSEGRVVLARVGIGVVARQGAPAPDLSSPEAVRKMLLEARAVTWSDPSTPGGGHLNRMIEQMGIADQVRPKLITKSAIDGGAELVAKGEAEYGFHLVSEMRGAKGVTLVGMLPPALQNFIVYGTAIPAGNADPEAALAFVKFVTDADKAERWKAAGFELVPGGK